MQQRGSLAFSRRSLSDYGDRGCPIFSQKRLAAKFRNLFYYIKRVAECGL